MNTIRKAFFLAALLLLASGCMRPVRQKPNAAESTPTQTAETSPASSGSINMPGRHDHTISVSGAAREFIVYVPESAKGASNAPVVVVIHGTTGDGLRFYNMSGWREKADQEGFLVVFPTALTYCFYEDENRDGDFNDRNEKQVTTKWDAGPLGGERYPLCPQDEIAKLTPAERALADHPLADDMAFFQSLFDFMEANYSINSKRVYVTGHSNGGQMAGRLAVEMSERIAAGASNESPLGVSGPSTRPISFILTYGNQDDNFVRYSNGKPYPLDESLIDLQPVKTLLVSPWLSALQLADEYEYSEGMIFGERYVQFTYASGSGSSFQLMFIDDLDHNYPNGKNHPVILANILWKFFSQFQLP